MKQLPSDGNLFYSGNMREMAGLGKEEVLEFLGEGTEKLSSSRVKR